MSRPVYEPSYARTDRKLGFSADQLFRRPAQNAPGTAIYEIKVFQDDVEVATGDDAFVWEIPEDLDGAAVVKVEAYISTAGSSDTTIQIRAGDPCDTGTDILSTPLTIVTGECNDDRTAVVIDPTVVAWGDHLHIDVDAAGTGSMGLGVIVVLAPAALASVVLAGAQGPAGAPGGIVAWMGAWSSATTYATNDAVSNNGSSYVAINGSTNVEPGVDAGWETDWMLLAAGAGGTSGEELTYNEITSVATSTATTEGTAGTVVTASAVVFDGTPVMVEFFCATIEAPGDGFAILVLYEDGTSIGQMSYSQVTVSGAETGLIDLPVYVARRITPSAASHTYSVRLYGSAGTKTVYAGAGGAATTPPAFIRITRV